MQHLEPKTYGAYYIRSFIGYPEHLDSVIGHHEHLDDAFDDFQYLQAKTFKIGRAHV